MITAVGRDIKGAADIRGSWPGPDFRSSVHIAGRDPAGPLIRQTCECKHLYSVRMCIETCLHFVHETVRTNAEFYMGM